MTFPELASIHLTVSPAARDRHLRAIAERLSRSGPRRSRRLLAVALAATLVIPVAAAAAEDAMPGEALYLVKRALEPVRELFEDDVAAVNRVEELETLLDRRALPQVIDRQLLEAQEAVAPTDRDDLRRRLVEATDRRPSLTPEPATPVQSRPPSSEATPTDHGQAPTVTMRSHPPSDRPPPDRTTAPPSDRRG
jgi:hypothetical protein